MTAPWRRAAAGLLAILIAIGLPGTRAHAAPADSCRGRGVEVDLAGSGDVGVVSGRSAATCRTPPRPAPRAAPPGTTDELLCPASAATATPGLCSASPCGGTGLSFALRTQRPPSGGQQVVRAVCTRVVQARAGPGISVAQVFQAVRAVRLPGGSVRATPSGRGLANLVSYFQRGGVTNRTVDLPLRGSVIHAEFQATEYRWRFGDGSTGRSLASVPPDSPGEAHAFSRSGRFQVRVEVAWSAQAFLDGRRVGRLDDLVSRAVISYPVAEVHTVLSG
jgi:hypothetical protein